MNILDYITIILFSVGVLVTGISFSKTGKDVKSFFSGGGNVPWGMSGLSLFMGFFSAGTFVVWGSIAYSCGLVSIIIQLTMAVAGYVVGFWIAPRWHRTRSLTAAGYITGRLGVNAQKIYTFIFLAVSVFTTGSFLYPVAKIVEVTAGVPLTTAILILGAFSMVYVALGGLRGVVVTDVLQFVILFAAVLIAVPLSFDKIGGTTAFFDSAPAGFFDFFNDEYTPAFVFAFALYNIFFLGGNWAYVQRYTSVKSDKDARRTGLLFGILYTISPILWMLIPMIYRIYNPSLNGLDNEGAYLLMCKEAMPAGLLGLMLGGMIFATASSLNATLNISAGVITNDIFKRLRPNASEHTLINVARLSTWGLGILAIIVALLIRSMGGIVNVVISVAALTGVPIYLPIIWSLFSKRQTARTILGVTFLSLFINLLFKFVTPFLGFELDRTGEMVTGTAIPVVLLMGIECVLALKNFTSPEYVAYKQRECTETDNVTPADTAVADETNSYTRRVLGLALSLSGILIITLGVLADGSFAVPVSVGATVALVGIYLLSTALRRTVTAIFFRGGQRSKRSVKDTENRRETLL